MPKPYMKQRETFPPEEAITKKVIDYLNPRVLPQFEELTGVNISKPGDKAPVSGGTPQLFILDEDEPSNPRSLEEEKVEIGSKRFWELIQRGKIFAYPSGQKEPVQLQLKVESGSRPEFFVSEPLSTQPDKLASRSFEYEEKPPAQKRLPPKAPQPGIFASIAHFFNSNWYKKEFEAYENSLRTREQITEQNRHAQEAFEARAAKAKQEAGDACRKVSAGLQQACGASRTEKTLAAEREAQRALREKRAAEKAQAALDQAALQAKNAANRTKDCITNMMSIFSPKPAPLPHLVKDRAYTKESYAALKPVTLPQDFKIGATPVDDRLFANLAFHAQLDPERAMAWHYPPEAQKKLRDEGLTQKEIEEMAVHKLGGMAIGDVISDHVRPQVSNYIDKSSQPGREDAEKALAEYRAGRKGPLANIIFRAAQYTAKGAKELNAGGKVALTDAKLTGELLDLLDQDPELRQAAREKGLTEKMEETCRGMDALQELEKSSLDAEEKLLKAVAEHRELTPEEKAECLSDIFKYRTADAMLKEQTAETNSKNFMTVKKQLTERQKATNRQKTDNEPMPKGMKPLDSIGSDMQEFHYRMQLLKTPSVMKELAEDQENLDKLTDMTLEGLKLDGKKLEELDTATLAEKLTGGKGPAGKNLMEQQGRLLQAEERAKKQEDAVRQREKQQEEALEEQLNNAVVYEPGKMQP